MVLSRKYVIRLSAGWGLFGAVTLLVGANCIGGAATFFMLVALASWTFIPLSHFLFAAFVARKINDDPTIAL